jgi:serine/threonine protein kinase
MTAQPQVAPLLENGHEIGGCRIERFVDAGGMGQVFQARHISLDKLVAVKILPPIWSKPENIERFLQEARIACRIEHRNVVRIFDVGRDGGLYYIVMQYVDGPDLKKWVDERGGLAPWREAVRIGRAAAQGLAAIHRHRLVHRDVKPRNIMVAQDGRVLLMDFGLVRAEGESDLTRTGEMVGTPVYMSPEQSRGDPLDGRSDVFSLGSTMYFLLAGVPPYTGTITEVVTCIGRGQPPPPLERVNPLVPREVAEAIARAMAPLPAQRFSSADEMAHVLEGLLKGSGSRADETLDETTAVHRGLLDTQPLVPAEVVMERGLSPALASAGAIPPELPSVLPSAHAPCASSVAGPRLFDPSRISRRRASGAWSYLEENPWLLMIGTGLAVLILVALLTRFVG